MRREDEWWTIGEFRDVRTVSDQQDMNKTNDEQRRRCRRSVADAATGCRNQQCRRLPSDRVEPKHQNPLDRRPAIYICIEVVVIGALSLWLPTTLTWLKYNYLVFLPTWNPNLLCKHKSMLQLLISIEEIQHTNSCLCQSSSTVVVVGCLVMTV